MASAVATPLERRFGRIAGLSEITSVSSLGSTSLTLQFDLDRDVDAAARDVQAAINAAARRSARRTCPIRPNYRKVNPADAPIMILALTSQTLPLAAGVRRRQHRARAEDRAGRRAWGRSFVGGGQQPAVRVQVDPAALAGARPRPRGRADRARRRPPPTQPKGALDGAAAVARRSPPTTSSSTPPTVPPLIVALPRTARRCGSATWRTVRRRRGEHPHRGLDRRQARGASIIVRRQPGREHHRGHRAREGAPARARERPSRPPSTSRWPSTAAQHHPRLGRATCSSRCSSAWRLVVLVVFVFLRSARATVIPSVAVPLSLIAHLRRDVPARLQPRQPLAHGAHHLHRVRGGRRHRGHRERRPATSRRATPPLQAALQGRQADRLHHRLHHRLAAGRVHPHPAHGRRRRPALPRVRGHAQRRHRGLGGRLADAHADDVRRACSARRRTKRPRPALPRSRALLRRHARAATRARSRWVLRHHALMLLVTLGDRRRSPSTSTWSCPRGSSRSRTPGRSCGFSEAPQDISFPAMQARQEPLNEVVHADPDVDARRLLHRRRRRLDRNTGNVFIAAQAARTASRPRDEVIGAPAAASWRTSPGINALPAVRAGRARRRPRQRARSTSTRCRTRT